MAPEETAVTTAVADGGAADTDLGVLDAPETTTETVESEHVEEQPQETEQVEQQQETTQEKEDPELQEFHGMVSAKLRGLVKAAPELSSVFKKYPKVQAEIEARFRREAALRDVFPTVAEARFMRDQFPNGQADVQALMEDVQEIEEIDKNFDQKDRDGNYAGHTKLIDNFFQRDRSAAVQLMRTLPREWARLDPASYNEVMGKIVGATFQQNRIAPFVQKMVDVAKGTKQDGLANDLTELLDFVNGFSAERPKPTQEQEQLARDRQQFERTKAETDKTTQNRFHAEFVTAAKKIQTDIIAAHPAIKRIEKAVPADKKASIIEQIRQNAERFLAKSPSFMRKMRAEYGNRNLAELNKLQQAAWSQPWLLNRMVRTVLAKEVPNLVSQNREAVRRTVTQRPTVPARNGERNSAPKGPHQVGGRWYKGDGTPFTTAEVFAGKHLAQQ